MKKLIIFSAGSFRFVLQDLVEYFQLFHSWDIQCVCAPAGLLRERIEKGARCDLFISANRENIDRLRQTNRIFRQTVIAYNRLLLTTLDDVKFRQKTFFELLFDRTLRLATSTPNTDPCGDYTWEFFDKIEQRFPTEGEALKQRALQLVGNENSTIVPKGEIASRYLLSQGYAEMMLGYAHYQAQLTGKGFLFYELPKEFSIRADYMSALLSDSRQTVLFFDFLCGEEAQRIIQNHGFYLE
ncbi:substrate-binding domain-containing protein [Rodentibacter myodis]|uniref:Molybdenum ABC transporter substrate-binding protein n=1 Tax=Rodentibacter myodis TaxID=1907939 RepID=A0A1V3JRP6_9PAST|nr:substrate-binding domain-containing protein [Rodentibacter myodis]OOF59075.1 molybdenum ABC transporter substrate-binding protein [Rodentibacter myodis]